MTFRTGPFRYSVPIVLGAIVSGLMIIPGVKAIYAFLKWIGI